MSKRWYLVLTVVIAVLLMLVGCAPAATPTPEKVVETVVVRETVEVQVTPTPVPEALKPTGEITIWGWPAADKAFEAIIEGFNEEYPDIKVTWEMIPGMAGGTRDALSTALAAGTGAPDISILVLFITPSMSSS